MKIYICIWIFLVDYLKGAIFLVFAYLLMLNRIEVLTVTSYAYILNTSYAYILNTKEIKLLNYQTANQLTIWKHFSEKDSLCRHWTRSQSDIIQK